MTLFCDAFWYEKCFYSFCYKSTDSIIEQSTNFHLGVPLERFFFQVEAIHIEAVFCRTSFLDEISSDERENGTCYKKDYEANCKVCTSLFHFGSSR